MYQPCTSTTVNYGELRSLTVTRKHAASRPNDDLPGAPSSTGRGLITRRSQVQILPPPPNVRPVQRPFPDRREGPLALQTRLLCNIRTTDVTFGFEPDGQRALRRWDASVDSLCRRTPVIAFDFLGGWRMVELSM